MIGPGTIVGERYELGTKLGQGGMGAVYLARHLVSGREVALKVIVAQGIDPEAVRRFKREAGASAAIRHEGVVEVLDAGLDLDQGVLFLAMELLLGESLRDRFRSPTTTREEKLDLLVALLDPLSAAHARGFVHRDLKPDNVFVERRADGTELVKLLDFGIARQLGHEGPSITVTGTGMGTPQYMAPEQALSAKGASPAADVWSVGVMLYEALVGRAPFEGGTAAAIILAVCTRAHAPVLVAAPQTSPELASLVDTCLAKSPEARPHDAHLLRELLRVALGMPPAPPDPVPPSASQYPPPAFVGESGWDTPTLSVTPAVTPSNTPPIPLREEHLEGFRIGVPPAWERRATSVPLVVAVFVDTASSDDPPPTLRVKREPFDGDTRRFVDMGSDAMAEIGTIHRTADASVGGHPGIEVEATFHTLDPPQRVITRCIVLDGEGWVITVYASTGSFARVRATLRKILDSLVIEGRHAPPR